MIVIPEIQNALGTLSSGQRDTESGSSPNNQEDREGSNGLKTKITKKDSWSAFDLRDTEDLSPYIVITKKSLEKNEKFKIIKMIL